MGFDNLNQNLSIKTETQRKKMFPLLVLNLYDIVFLISIFYMILSMKTRRIRFEVMEDHYDYLWLYQIIIYFIYLFSFFSQRLKSFPLLNTDQNRSNSVNRHNLAAIRYIYEWKWPWAKIQLCSNLGEGVLKDKNCFFMSPSTIYSVV